MTKRLRSYGRAYLTKIWRPPRPEAAPGPRSISPPYHGASGETGRTRCGLHHIGQDPGSIVYGDVYDRVAQGTWRRSNGQGVWLVRAPYTILAICPRVAEFA